MKIVNTLIIILILLASTHNAIASSSGDESHPPAGGGGGGGGGGSPQFFDYFIPLVFNSSNPRGSSEIVVWSFQRTTIITTFALDKAGSNRMDLETKPTKLVFNTEDNIGLTNGSLIRSTAPLLVTGQRLTQDIYSDNSFAYSILPSRMMAFEFKAPFDGWLSIFTQQPVEVRLDNPSLDFPKKFFSQGGIMPAISVREGDYINSTEPMLGAFISYTNGTSATIAMPRYLKGNDYVLDTDISAPREDEIDRSYIQIDPEKPTKIIFTYNDGHMENATIFDRTYFKLDSNLRAINSTRGYIDVSLHIQYEYAGVIRASTVQLASATEMRAGELFFVPSGYSSHFGIINTATSLISVVYREDPSKPGYYLSSRRIFNRTRLDTYRIIPEDPGQIIVANDSLFSVVVSPGFVGNPMSPSIAFFNIPLNSQSTKYTQGLKSTWYRYPNLAVKSIEVVPGPPEEYTGQIIRVTILSNGSLPTGKFSLKIVIDDEEPFEKTYDFMQAGAVTVFEFRRFLNFGKTMLNVTVNLDINNDVNEINENDNFMRGDFNVLHNLRIRVSLYMILIATLIYIGYRVRKYLITQRDKNRQHIDAIITMEVEE